MGVADIHGAGADTDKRRVAAAPVNGGALGQAEVQRRLRSQASRHIRRPNNIRQVLRLYPKKLTHLRAPSPRFRTDIVEESSKSRILSHCEIACASQDQVILDIKPLVDLSEDLRLISLDPLVLPYRVLDTSGNGASNPEARDELCYISACDLDPVSDTLADLIPRPLIHIAHRAPQSIAIPVNKDKALHLRAERNTRDHIRSNAELSLINT